jgi:N-acetyl-anhydromuramyl-L-alanine amidase AmpD
MPLVAADREVLTHLKKRGMECAWLPSPNHNERPADAPIDTLIVHFTALDFQPSIAHLSCPQKEVSTHYVIDRDGSLAQLVSVARRGWHAGVGELRGRGDVNSYSVGLDLVFVPGQDLEYTAIQYRVLGELTRALVVALPIKEENVVGHEHVALPRGRKADPGPAFDWQRYFVAAGLEVSPPVAPIAGRG